MLVYFQQAVQNAGFFQREITRLQAYCIGFILGALLAVVICFPQLVDG